MENTSLDGEKSLENNDDSVVPIHETSEEHSSETGPSFNPVLPEELENAEDLEKVKGDAIGDTLYSERFVLSTLLKLAQIETDLSENEDFEKDLCNLWDMTIEKDVVKLLLRHNVLELFTGIIKATEDKRLVEILIGIMGNMCTSPQTRSEICANPDILLSLLDLLSCTDTRTLIQLMRFIQAALVIDSSGDENLWYQHIRNCEDFVEKIGYILMNSMNRTLLVGALEALCTICGKFAIIEFHEDENLEATSFRDVFVKPTLIMGVIEAFKTLLPNGTESNALSTERVHKIVNAFLDIHVALSNYMELSQSVYEPFIPELMKCLSQILSPLCQPIFLLPITPDEQGMIENTTEIISSLEAPFDEVIFAQMITIWKLVVRYREEKSDDSPNSWDKNCDDSDDINPDDVIMSILEFIMKSSKRATNEQLKSGLSLHSPRTIKKLISTLGAGDSEPDIMECCTKIKTAFEEVSNEDGSVESR